MPTYRTPAHGISISESFAEAMSVAPIERAMLSAFELYHPLGTPTGPIYVVDDLQPITAAIEAGATRNAGVAVTFFAAAVAIGRPDESDASAAPEVTVSVTNVSGLMAQALRASRGSLVPWELIERVYASDDFSGPAQLPPMRLLLSTAEMEGANLSLRAGFGDPGNVSIPRLTFRRPAYPGLVR